MESFFDFEYEENSNFGLNPEEDLNYLIQIAKENIHNLDKDLIEKSFWYCYKHHNGVLRKSGVPYYTHPLNVSLILLNEFPNIDSPTIAAALLHDVIEDVEGIKVHHIEEEFGKEVAIIVDAVTKIRHEEMNKIVSKTATYRKLFLALIRDVRVVLIKLADRLHNIRTLHYLRPDRQKDIAIETLNFYTPLAHRLGLNKIKMELENLSFYFSDKPVYEAIRQALNEKRRDFIHYIQNFMSHIEKNLNIHNIKHTLSIIHKHEYEIFIMMQDGKFLNDIDNFYSVVIIIDSDDISECYRAHGVLVNAFSSITFLDYISNSKLDWYKTLISEVIGPDGKRVEIIIRTAEMEKISEEGFASQYNLTTGRKRSLGISEEEIELWGAWMQDVIENNEENATPIIWESIKINLFDSELNVYNKLGNPIKLPKGASVLDFAYNKSIEDGFRCISAKVNGVVKDISYKLQNGDQIEIITTENNKPKPEMIQYVVSQRAVVQLYLYFKNNPIVEDIEDDIKENFDVILKIIGEDKEGMLGQITLAVGSNSMKRISVDSYENVFEANILMKIKNLKELNKLFAKLLTIKGIKSVEKIDNKENKDNYKLF